MRGQAERGLGHRAWLSAALEVLEDRRARARAPSAAWALRSPISRGQALDPSGAAALHQPAADLGDRRGGPGAGRRRPRPLDEAVAHQRVDDPGHRRRGDALAPGERADGLRPAVDEDRQRRQPGAGDAVRAVVARDPPQQVDRGRVQPVGDLDRAVGLEAVGQRALRQVAVLRWLLDSVC